MSTVFNKTNKNFSQINNELLFDKELSFGARGLMCLMLSRPESWDFNMKELASNTKESYTKVQNYMKELEDRKYVIRLKRGVAGVKGKFEWLYFLNGKSFSDDEIQKISQEYSKINTSNDNPILRQSLNTTVVNNDNRKIEVYSNTELLSNTEYINNTNINSNITTNIGEEKLTKEQIENRKNIELAKEKIRLEIMKYKFNITPEKLLQYAVGDYELVLKQFKHFSNKGLRYLIASIKDKYPEPNFDKKEEKIIKVDDIEKEKARKEQDEFLQMIGL